ncbi:surface lipoprotein assembly modifier [Rheinheimera nanhaiensis]|uniref:Surface lipoprotein assembly modifier C-terminal domain-containing protein n=1 Tax=Rheinheimera nanhaiensis E407-8 TaxID=562729 RepID=I1E0R9_9GAMM|nr:surface lipoprotein assembly modifier [Rheinheimera nanhaiensis]GAB59897.1 hypothetical protein RNAN_2910 [Rheinheimera nanhaiensis E407-8]
MATFIRIKAAAAALCLCFSLPMPANDNISFSASARAGLEQQSNVNISALEQASGQADVARLFEADARIQWQSTPALRVEAGYSLQDKNYRQADDFDSRLQLAHLDASYQIGAHSLGSNFYYAKADIAQTPFLTLKQASLYSMHSIGASRFIRPSITLSEKIFDQISQRNASNTSASIQTFWFFAQAQRFVTLGLHYEDESSRDNAFSYLAPGLSVRFSARWSLWQFEQQVQFGAKWSQRRYTARTATDNNADNSRRRDNHSQFDAHWQLNLSKNLATLIKLEHGNFSSTLASADYRETRGALALQLSF